MTVGAIHESPVFIDTLILMREDNILPYNSAFCTFFPLSAKNKKTLASASVLLLIIFALHPCRLKHHNIFIISHFFPLVNSFLRCEIKIYFLNKNVCKTSDNLSIEKRFTMCYNTSEERKVQTDGKLIFRLLLPRRVRK